MMEIIDINDQYFENELANAHSNTEKAGVYAHKAEYHLEKALHQYTREKARQANLDDPCFAAYAKDASTHHHSPIHLFDDQTHYLDHRDIAARNGSEWIIQGKENIREYQRRESILTREVLPAIRKEENYLRLDAMHQQAFSSQAEVKPFSSLARLWPRYSGNAVEGLADHAAFCEQALTTLSADAGRETVQLERDYARVSKEMQGMTLKLSAKLLQKYEGALASLVTLDYSAEVKSELQKAQAAAQFAHQHMEREIKQRAVTRAQEMA